jgi:transcriptional regulator with XRE-family HTH domain
LEDKLADKQRQRVYPKKIFGGWLRDQRNRAQLSQEELAAQTGGIIAQTDISRLERGRNANPGIMTVLVIAQALDLDLGDLAPLVNMKPIRMDAVKEGRLPAKLGRYLEKIEDQVDEVRGMAQRALSTAKGTVPAAKRSARASGRRKR